MPTSKTGQRSETVTPEDPEVSGNESQSTAVENATVSDVIEASKARHGQIFQTFIDWLVERAQTTDEDQHAIMAAIMADVLASESIEEVLRERATLSAGDVLNMPLLLHSFEIREGDYEDSLTGFYAALTVSKPGTDKTRVVTTGANKVMAKLCALDRFGEWPQLVKFTAKTARSGNDVIDIVRFSDSDI